MWKVFKLTNSALSECCVGVTDGDPHDALREAANGEIEAIDYWDAEEHRITVEVVRECGDRASAESLAASLRTEQGCIPFVPPA